MTTITEDYVSFEVAKLLKEKGFNEPCRAIYSPKGVVRHFLKEEVYKHYLKGHKKLCPTHQMAMAWLREVNGLFITIYPNYGTEKIAWSVHQRDYDMNWVTIKHNYADSYEEAVEAAIKYCLENLI
jgi:hypothetical protein